MPDEDKPLPDSAFRPPDDGKRDKIELESGWAKEKADRVAAATTFEAPKKSKAPFVVGLLVVLAGLGALGYFVFINAKKDTQHEKVLPGGEGTVSIEVRTNIQALVRIDGHKAGRSPLTLHVPKKGQQVMIEVQSASGNPQTKQVTADRDQVVDFVLKP